MAELHIAAAIVRRRDDVLMIRQAGPGEEPYWSVPAGRVEPGEFVTDALRREVREETGIDVLDPGTLAFLAQVDDQREGWFATVWTWDVATWRASSTCAIPTGSYWRPPGCPLPMRSRSWRESAGSR
jgi:ADP-ribose pyrophosphatase YjhB (NUDIX family)